MDHKRKNDLAYLIDRKAEAILAKMDPESIVAEMKVAYPDISEEELVFINERIHEWRTGQRTPSPH